MVYNQNFTQSVAENGEDAFEILHNMVRDEYLCHYCIKNHSSFDNINKILEIHKGHAQQRLRVSRLRLVLNIFGIFNIVLVCIVYGGPAIINSLTCITALCILIAPFVNKFSVMIFIESSVVLLATVVTIQCCYCIIVATLEIEKKRPKTE